MSGNGYNYYYPQPNTNYNEKQWSEWTTEQQNFNAGFVRNPMYDPVHPVAVSHTTVTNTHIPPPPPPRTPYYNYYGSPQNAARPYHTPRRYNNVGNNQYTPSQQSWSRNTNSYKRTRLDSDDQSEPKNKTKKRKKPLSQNVPSKKDWTLEEAETALNCEKEYNKRHKNHSLIIKFPDLELNKEIVSKFHSAIENVHFQQPSTARFCFVALEESADANEVISTLNKVKFGDGYLTAEYKKDREEDQNIGPEDIDPYTLYVGNLAQEITKEDMVTTYPKSKRIDIGYAKKMKYTRYAFVTFKSIVDSIEAFKKTHSTQMHSKSLIVRFRRLHGTVGMPGESKPNNPPKSKDSTNIEEPSNVEQAPTPIIEEENNSSTINKPVNLQLVKQEPESSDDEERKRRMRNLRSVPLVPDKLLTFPKPIKEEPNFTTKLTDQNGLSLEIIDDDTPVLDKSDSKTKHEYGYNIKAEPGDTDDDEESVDEYMPDISSGRRNQTSDNSDDNEDDDFDNLYNKMVKHANNMSSIKNKRNCP